MTILYDEQIIAAVYALKNWRSFTELFLISLYYSDFSRMLTALNIVWKRTSEKDTFKKLASKYPEYFELKEGSLVCKKSSKETYSAFLETIHPDVLEQLAKCLGSFYL